MSGFLTKEQIFSADDRRYEVVDIPEWGGKLRLKSITGVERDAYEKKSLIRKGDQQEVNIMNLRARLVVMCAVDEHGAPVFGPNDVMTLSSKGAAPLARAFEACQRLCGFTDEDVKELEEGFDSAQSEVSISG